MNELKVLFVGIGSIAKRHINNLQFVCQKIDIPIRIDAFRRNAFSSNVEGVKQIYCSVADTPDDYDVIFITNPTEFHLETLRCFHNKGKHYFIEKPVVSLKQLDSAKEFITRSNSIYYVACPLRYNAVIQWIKNNVNYNDVISVRSISSSYLPEWRPGQDYRETYSAHKEMGGGVSIDLIHEWDYLTYLFGWPQKIQCLIGKKSTLDIDSDDYAIYIAELKDKIVELHLDYFGRKTIREIQLFTKDDTIIGDIVNNRIFFLLSKESINFYEERDDYQKRELEYFLDMIKGKIKTQNEFEHAIRVIRLSQGDTSI